MEFTAIPFSTPMSEENFLRMERMEYIMKGPGAAGDSAAVNMERLSDRFPDFARSQTPCADMDPSGSPVCLHADPLKIGPEDPLGLVVGMADIVAGYLLFATN
jgi:hypothetical protein